MSRVKEECEDIGVMEASGLKVENKEMEKGHIFQEYIKEEFKLEVEPFEEECAAQKSEQSSSDSFQQKDHLSIPTGEARGRHMDIHEGMMLAFMKQKNLWMKW
ncbi:hypothetical protein MHYP_G00106200 [Metynnis hypsauchen]